MKKKNGIDSSNVGDVNIPGFYPPAILNSNQQIFAS
jgi:hypothetical protein